MINQTLNDIKEKTEVNCSSIFIYNPSSKEFSVVVSINGKPQTITAQNLKEIFELLHKLVEKEIKSPSAIARAKINSKTTEPEKQTKPRETKKQDKKRNEQQLKIHSLF